jgi:hypothetical protein
MDMTIPYQIHDSTMKFIILARLVKWVQWYHTDEETTSQ